MDFLFITHHIVFALKTLQLLPLFITLKGDSKKNTMLLPSIVGRAKTIESAIKKRSKELHNTKNVAKKIESVSFTKIILVKSNMTIIVILKNV